MSADDFADGMGRLEELIARVEGTCSPESLSLVRELVQALLDVHRGGLKAMLAAVNDPQHEVARRALLGQPAVESLLLMHDLHPAALSDRVDRALVETNLAAPGSARAALVRLDGADVHVVVRGSQAGVALLRKLLDRALCERAPDATLHVAEELDGSEPVSRSVATGNLVPVERLRLRRGTG